MIEDILQKIARQIMALNEETLTALLPRYKQRMMDFAPTKEWEEAVVIYFLINGLRIKNSQFNDKVREYMAVDESGDKCGPHIRPRLRLVKTDPAEEGGAPVCPGFCPGCQSDDLEDEPRRDTRKELVTAAPEPEADLAAETSDTDGPHEHD